MGNRFAETFGDQVYWQPALQDEEMSPMLQIPFNETARRFRTSPTHLKVLRQQYSCEGTFWVERWLDKRNKHFRNRPTKDPGNPANNCQGDIKWKYNLAINIALDA